MNPPKRITVNVPGVLVECLERRLGELKFRSVSGYFLSLMIFDFWKRIPHSFTGSLHNERPEVQDQIYNEVARDFEQLAAKPPAWFTIRLQELVDEEIARRESGKKL